MDAIRPTQAQPPQKDIVPRRYTDAPSAVGDDGYVWEWCPTHPWAKHGVVLQHRLVKECELGRFLERRERVHHDDKVRSNNDKQNLVLMSSQSEHMREHWKNSGRRDPALIAEVLQAASDKTRSVASLPCSPTTTALICREHGANWVSAHSPRCAALTEASVNAALQGRTTRQAAAYLGVTQMTLYRRFDHLLKKRATPRQVPKEPDARRVELARRRRVRRHREQSRARKAQDKVKPNL